MEEERLIIFYFFIFLSDARLVHTLREGLILSPDSILVQKFWFGRRDRGRDESERRTRLSVMNIRRISSLALKTAITRHQEVTRKKTECALEIRIQSMQIGRSNPRNLFPKR